MSKQQIIIAHLEQIKTILFTYAREIVKVLPSAIAVGIIAIFSITSFQHIMKRKIIRKRKYAMAGLISYSFMILEIAVFSRPFGSVNQVDFIPFNMPGGTYLIILYSLANTALFIPVGIMLPMIWERIGKLKYMFVIGVFVSVTIEITQYLLQCGICQTEDVIMNTIGMVIGFLLYQKAT